MSRIDEAMRRAGVRPTGSNALRANDGQTFRAPWPIDAAPEASPADRSELPSEGETSLQQVTPISTEWLEQLVVSPTISPTVVEQFRRLAATLHVAQTATNQLKVLLITSAEAGDGKTFTAANLALTLSESYHRRVLLVDMDFRRPALSHLTKDRPTRGLAEGLRASTEQKLPVLRVTERLTLLPAGHPEADPMSSLTSPRMQRVLSEAAQAFDWVVLDAPPLCLVPDARLVAMLADAVLLVVRAGQTHHESVQRAVDIIGRERIFGVVLNGAEEASLPKYDRQYGYYAKPGEPR
ncbi:MAG: CpsD/CapB family tyrosine-protein kinase [Vicinamibacterales bacterium]